MLTHSAQVLHLTREHSQGHDYSPRIPSQIPNTAGTHYTREKPIGLRRFFTHSFSRSFGLGTTNTLICCRNIQVQRWVHDIFLRQSIPNENKCEVNNQHSPKSPQVFA